MKTAIAYIITILGLPVAVAGVIPLFLSFLYIPILKKLNSKVLWFIFDFVIEAIGGIVMIWLTIILWTWLKVTPSILIPILLAIPIIIWNWKRIRKTFWNRDKDECPDPFLDELASGLGELSGVVIGAIFFFYYSLAG